MQSHPTTIVPLELQLNFEHLGKLHITSSIHATNYLIDENVYQFLCS